MKGGNYCSALCSYILYTSGVNMQCVHDDGFTEGGLVSTAWTVNRLHLRMWEQRDDLGSCNVALLFIHAQIQMQEKMDRLSEAAT